METVRVSLRNLSTEGVRAVDAGNRVEVTRNGRVIAIMTPPDPNEVALDDLARAGAVPDDWRDRQAALQDSLSAIIAGTNDGGTTAVIKDRAESTQ